MKTNANKTLTSQSAFLYPRFLVSFGLCVIGLLVALLAFALSPGGNAGAATQRPPQYQANPQGQYLTQKNIPLLQGRLTPVPASASAVSITPLVESGEIDMDALGIHPLSTPLGPVAPPPVPSGALVGFGNATLSVSPEVCNQSTKRAFVAVGANFIPGETVHFSLNGGAASALLADTEGRFGVSIDTPAGFGFIAIDVVGVTSGRHAGGVVQVASTGPYLPGLAVAPHAIKPTGSSTIHLMGRGFAPATSVTLRRNGMSLGTTTTTADGGFFAAMTVAAGADSSAVYSADDGTTGSLVGQTVEERSDAGTPPLGDQNIARALTEHSVIDSATGGPVAVVGEGFQVGEAVAISGCASGTLTADTNRAVGFFLDLPAGSGVTTCTLTGGTSGRIARASVLADQNVANMRGLIGAPAYVTPESTTAPTGGNSVIFYYHHFLRPNSRIQIYVDGFLVNELIGNGIEIITFAVPIPATGGVHAVQCIGDDGSEAQTAALFVGPRPTSQTVNVSTRMNVAAGDNVGIGGFILTGTAPKHVLLRAIGPSLIQAGVPNALADPLLELHGPGPFVTIMNDNWRDDPAQEAAILATGIPPINNLESAIDATLNPGAYTGVVRGKNNTSGVGLIEVYDLDQAVSAKLANISTRALVSTGDNIVIAGFVLGNHTAEDRVAARGIGPSLTSLGVPNALADPVLELRDGNGTLLLSNNDWQDNPDQASELTAAGLAPTSPLESGMVALLPPGRYTALLSGLQNTLGVGLVEIYDLGTAP